MAAAKEPVPYCAHTHPQHVEDGTLCRTSSPKPGAVGVDAFRVGQARRLRILALDGAKTHEFLFHVAVAEIQWQDLNRDPRAALESPASNERALDRASLLYHAFLDACSKGPKQARAFLADQHRLLKQYSAESITLLQSLGRKNQHDQALLAKLAFAMQVVKSLATIGVAALGLFVAAPEALAGAGVALGYELTLDFIRSIESANQPEADTVVIGFKQTVANHVVEHIAVHRQVSLDATEKILKKTLNYPLKSSIYRSAIKESARLEALLRTFGGLLAAITLYTEARDSYHSFEQMRAATSSH